MERASKFTHPHFQLPQKEFSHLVLTDLIVGQVRVGTCRILSRFGNQ